MRVPKLSRKHAILLTICFGLGCFTRLTGLGHGTAENFPTDDTTGFQRFHPDEEMLIRSALVLKSPLQPPQTNYGMLPLYLLRVSYESACTVSGLDIDDLSVASNPRLLFGIARVLSAVLSCAALVLVGLMALRYLGATAACLALFFVAMSPAAVQQAHFYTVDGLFTLMSLSALYCCLRALENRSVGWYLATGILVGFAGAVRLNGLALGAIPLAGLLIRYHWRSLYTKDLWIVAGASIAPRAGFAANLPSGSTIGTEGGAFSMRPLIDADRYRLVPLKVHTLFNSQGYTTCAYSLDLLHDHVAAMEHLAIVEVNRSQQYRAVPELFPAVSAFYTGLAEQSLGFQLVQRFRNYPNWLGFEFNDDGAEPSFTSYDHPTVLIFQRADPPVFERA